MMKFIVVSPMKPFFESHHRRAIFYYGPQQDSSLFVKKPRVLLLEAVLRVHGRRPQCSSRQSKSPPSNVKVLSEGGQSHSSLKDSSISTHHRFVMIPAPVIRSLPSIFFENSRRPDSLPTKPRALITNLLSLIPTSVHLMISGTRPLVKASLSSHRRSRLSVSERTRPLITRCRSN